MFCCDCKAVLCLQCYGPFHEEHDLRPLRETYRDQYEIHVEEKKKKKAAKEAKEKEKKGADVRGRAINHTTI